MRLLIFVDNGQFFESVRKSVGMLDDQEVIAMIDRLFEEIKVWIERCYAEMNKGGIEVIYSLANSISEKYIDENN